MTDDERADMDRFLNRLRILHSLDTWDVVSTTDPDRAWLAEFVMNPVQVLLRSDAGRQAQIWAALRRREGND